ncbi:oxidoreductase, aldo/keto reductase family [Synechococcus sp. PCC 7335]|uniref:aldo/keto reductase n=1 Tax=Synechococcus sp. (strain ATCC 29403 / PCC 7335) TaxID=91464 RepID=UPI00017EDC62|nr:aldo/keto reductase [Synechococcus sp. PCC 7335]EDX84202.1 oxidoreductase, aldo/keto reductase family [Synechococcus sp. PCC 7335]
MHSPATALPPLPKMGCGTWAWGNRLLWNYQESMNDQLQAVFNHCVSRGVTLFDTGDSYGTGRLSGQSETLLGQFSASYSGQNKEKICLATKLAPYPWRLSKRSMLAAGQASAQRLGQLDIVQMHWSTANYLPFQEGPLLDGLAELCQRGSAKGLGLSNYGPKRLRWAHQRLADQGVKVCTLQVQYSLLSTYPISELDLKSVCDDLGIQLIAYSPLALGLLTGKYTQKADLPKGLRRFALGQILPDVQPLLNCLRAIAKANEKTMAQTAINWCICKGTIPIPGAKTVQQAQQNTGALGWHLTTAEITELDNASAACRKQMVQNIFQSR